MEESENQRIEPIIDTLYYKWTIPVISTLRKGTLRYSAIEKALPRISQRALTMTLRRLELNGMLDRYIYPSVPPQVEYKLTPLGCELLALSTVISEWAEMHCSEIRRAQKAYGRRNRARLSI